MKIAILGSGAMGSLFGSMLIKGGHEVCLIDVWKEHVEKLQRDGLTIHTYDKEENIKVNAVLTAKEALTVLDGFAEMVIVFVKGTHTDSAMRSAGDLIGHGTKVMTVQNGVGNADIINKYVPANQVYYGTTTVGASIKGPGHIVYYPPQKETITHIMPLDGVMTHEIKRLADVLTACGLTCKASEDTELLVWEKLVLNCIGNPLSVVTRLYSNAISTDENGVAITEMIINEVCSVAQAKGLPLSKEKFDWIIPFCSKLNRFASMGYDAMEKKPTEIEMINGAVVREGKRLGIPTPVNSTLYHLVKIISNNYDELVY